MTVPEALTVHVNRGELHSLDPPDSFETSESFDVRLVNHGEATHVHLHLDDSLSQLAAIDAPNHHVDRQSERRVAVALTREGAARGNLKVVTAYGATTRYVEITVTEPEEPERKVAVSEELGKPQPKPADDSPEVDIPLGPVSGVGGAAVLLAVGAAAISQGAVVTLAATVVAIAAAAAIIVAWAN